MNDLISQLLNISSGSNLENYDFIYVFILIFANNPHFLISLVKIPSAIKAVHIIVLVIYSDFFFVDDVLNTFWLFLLFFFIVVVVVIVAAVVVVVVIVDSGHFSL